MNNFLSFVVSKAYAQNIQILYGVEPPEQVWRTLLSWAAVVVVLPIGIVIGIFLVLKKRRSNKSLRKK